MTPAAPTEQALVFSCAGESLCGILHPGKAGARLGVLVVVGGPQYRVGSHRQFVHLARHLANAGVPVLRFDYRGMGDSEGCLRDFQDVSEDIRASLDQFSARLPDLERFVIWGLCDAASAAAFYVPGDARVAGLVLLNPWVRTEQGQAQTLLKHYYWQRLRDPDLWRKVLRLEFDLLASLRSALGLVRQAKTGQAAGQRPEQNRDLPLPERMLRGLQAFTGPVLLILSERDLTAQEFKDILVADAGWAAWLARDAVEREDLASADHTFSSAVWRERVANRTLTWLDTIENAS